MTANDVRAGSLCGVPCVIAVVAGVVGVVEVIIINCVIVRRFQVNTGVGVVRGGVTCDGVVGAIPNANTTKIVRGGIVG